MSVALEFTDRGRGTPLLLIHGFPLDRSIWSAQVADLAGSTRVIAPDLRGFGSSPDDPPAASLEDYAADLLALMDSLKIDRFVPAGHSMGGYILFALHRLAPQRFAGAALVATKSAPESESGRKAREETAQRVLQEGVEFLAGSMPGRMLKSVDVLPRVRKVIASSGPTGVVPALRAMAGRPDSASQLASMKFPVAVIAGSHDALIPAAEAKAMAAALPSATLRMCETSGHLPMLEEPEVVTDALQSLMGSIR